MLALDPRTRESHFSTTLSGLWEVAALSKYTNGLPWTLCESAGNIALIPSMFIQDRLLVNCKFSNYC
jgi:hypothetical protein